MRYAVGVDIGGTKTSVALVGEDGHCSEVISASTPAKAGGAAVLDNAAAMIRRLCDPRELLGVGVGAAGVVDTAGGRIVSSTDTFTDWAGTDVVAGLRHRLGFTADMPVKVHNDVDAHALGEQWRGAAQGLQSMLLVAVGTGVGGAVMLNSQLWTGARHIAGEVGHFPARGAEGMRCPCGKEGHLEAVAAGPAIERRYAQLAGVARSGREIMALAAVGDGIACAVVQNAARALGHVVAGLATTFDPAVVVIGGGLSQAGQLWWDTLRATVTDDVVVALQDLEIVAAKLGPEAAIVGAASAVIASREGA